MFVNQQGVLGCFFLSNMSNWLCYICIYLMYIHNDVNLILFVMKCIPDFFLKKFLNQITLEWESMQYTRKIMDCKLLIVGYVKDKRQSPVILKSSQGIATTLLNQDEEKMQGIGYPVNQ